MSRGVPFKRHLICDDCGALGAYDFMGDSQCQACFERTAVEAELAEEPGQ